ncbi:MAG: DNA replication/repair protein RecF [Candidatus Izemoplasma sp.]
MYVKTLNLKSFRVYDSIKLSFNPNTNIIIGNNGQGKTTILESLYVLGLTKSHKTNTDKELIKNSANFAKINSVINLNNKDMELDITLSKVGKKAKYNHIEFLKLSEYIGKLNVVMFAPEDLELVKGNPQNRRKFLDLEIGQISKNYLTGLQKYKKALKERNSLLKTMQKSKDKNMVLLDVVTDQLVVNIDSIVTNRKEFINKISNFANEKYKKLADDSFELKIKYIPSIETNFKEEHIKKYQYDIITGSTSLGPHRDDVEFYLNGETVKNFCSQGEIRSVILALKLALIDFVYEYRGEYPILLLDDVLSELDDNRQNKLMGLLNNKTQTFITTTQINEIKLDNISNYTVFSVFDGQIKERD